MNDAIRRNCVKCRYHRLQPRGTSVLTWSKTAETLRYHRLNLYRGNGAPTEGRPYKLGHYPIPFLYVALYDSMGTEQIFINFT